jgi:Na+/H+-dicarboxylate symporter
LLEGAKRLGLPAEASSLTLPLAVAVFKVNRTLSSTIRLLMVAAMFSVPVDAGTLAAFLFTVFLLSFTTPGLPGAGSMATLPAYLAAGLPLEGVMLFEALDAIPDVFKTVANVTADLSAAAIVSRLNGAGAVATASAD